MKNTLDILVVEKSAFRAIEMKYRKIEKSLFLVELILEQNEKCFNSKVK